MSQLKTKYYAFLGDKPKDVSSIDYHRFNSDFKPDEFAPQYTSVEFQEGDDKKSKLLAQVVKVKDIKNVSPVANKDNQKLTKFKKKQGVLLKTFDQGHNNLNKMFGAINTKITALNTELAAGTRTNVKDIKNTNSVININGGGQSGGKPKYNYIGNSQNEFTVNEDFMSQMNSSPYKNLLNTGVE